MEMKIFFPGGKKVSAEYMGFIHRTDQAVRAGGEGSAPPPFDLFLASIGTCAGIYILGFCQQRGIDASQIEIIQRMHWNPDSRLIDTIEMEIMVPGHFPEKYRQALIQSAQLCAVKKHLENPPRFEITTIQAS